MTNTTLTYPWQTLRRARGFIWGAFVVCFLALLTIVVVGWASDDLFQFLLGCTLFFTALCFARPFAGTALAGRRDAFLMAALTIWVFLMVSQAIFSHDQTTASAVHGHVDPSAIFQAFSWLLSLAGIALITWARPAYLARLFAGPMKWASIFAIVAVLSCPISPKPLYSATLAFKLCLIVLTLCAIAEAIEDETGLFRFFSALFLGTFVVVSKAFLAGLVKTEFFMLSDRLPMVGLSGASGLLLLLCLLFFFLKKNLLFVSCGMYSLIVMMLAGNKGGMIASFVSLMMFFLLLKRPVQALAAGAGFAFILALCIAFTPLGQTLQRYSQEGNAGTLTGRTNLWAEAWPQIRDHPILGNGYRSSRFLSEEVPGVFQEAGNMHNSFLEVLYNNGLAGLIPIIVMNVLIVVNLRAVIIHPPTPYLRYYAAATLALQTQLVIWGLVATTFGGAPDDRFMMFLALLPISMFLRAQADKNYRNTVYGDIS